MPQALSNCYNPPAPVWSTPAAGAGVIRLLVTAQTWRGSPGGVVGSGAEHSIGTLDQETPLMAHKHTRDSQETYPPSSKFQSLQLLKAAYCISNSISKTICSIEEGFKNFLIFYRILMVLQGLTFHCNASQKPWELSRQHSPSLPLEKLWLWVWQCQASKIPLLGV